MMDAVLRVDMHERTATSVHIRMDMIENADVTDGYFVVNLAEYTNAPMAPAALKPPSILRSLIKFFQPA